MGQWLATSPGRTQKGISGLFYQSGAGLCRNPAILSNKEHPWQKIIEVVDELKNLCPNDVSSEKVIALLGNRPIDSLGLKYPEGEIESYAYVQLQEITQIVNNIKK